MKTLGVIANCEKDHAASALRRIRVKADLLGLRLLADPPTAAHLAIPSEGPLPVWADRIDALVVLGGDGSMLRAVRDLAGKDIPVMGMNLGGLGFLTSVAEGDIERALESLAGSQIRFSHRTMMSCVVFRDGAETARYCALNDIVLASASHRVANLSMSINGERVSDFVCDGLILSTPTGSTGHSLSSGGPILHPTASVFVVSLICPHTLSTRPLVLPDDSSIRVAALHRSGNWVLTCDGQTGQTLEAQDLVEVHRSPHGVRFIHLPDYSYFSVLRQKLLWRGSIV